MKTICLISIVLSIAKAGTPVASPMYTAARETWLEVIATRFELARYRRLQRTDDLASYRSDASLARAMGVRKSVVQRWANGDAGFTLAEGLIAAEFLGAESWWLLGYDVLYDRFWSRNTINYGPRVRPTHFAHPRFAEILLDARAFDPRACDGLLDRIGRIDATALRGDLDAFARKRNVAVGLRLFRD